MIGKLTGTLIDKQPGKILLEVNQIGYEIEISLADYANLPDLNTKLEVFTHLHVREDAQLLYGFLDKNTKETFRQLIKANGVGAKLALVILAGLDANQLTNAVQNKDVTLLTKIPGIGKKTAERLIIELSDKLTSDLQLATDAQPDASNQNKAEAEAALVALGYKNTQARKALNSIAEPNMTVQQLIRLALQQI